MFCANCGNQIVQAEKFCRKCGATLSGVPVDRRGNELIQMSRSADALTVSAQKDPDELIGTGVASVFIGDGFFMVAVILSATDTAFSSLLWLLLLIPAFFFFGKGFRDIWQARQILRRLKQNELTASQTPFSIQPPTTSMFETIKKASGDLLSGSSVTERTTRQLE